MSNGQDPREIVTPDAFSVSPDLLGLPLAHPWRRAAAILIDLALIGLLANAKGFLLALAGGSFLFWLAFRGRKAGLGSTLARTTIGCGGALAVFVAVLAIWGSLFLNENAVLFEAEGQGGEKVPVTLGSATDVLSLLGADDTVAAEDAAARLVRRLEADGVAPEDIRAAVADIGEDDAVARAIGRAVAASEATPRPDYQDLDLDSLLTVYRAARSTGDTATEQSTALPLGRLLARADQEAAESEIGRLEARNERLSAELGEKEDELEAERNRGIINTIVRFLDELGLGIGWSGLYFTFLTAFLKGRTPGKRALGIRVVRLDGNALTYWVAFERFGGYAASLFTGMEGFLRILWDRNRQCLEDKLAETVVIRDTKQARAQLAVGAAKRATTDVPWKGGPIRGT
jgi:uncharacterized RDD family membrane protein YckC